MKLSSKIYYNWFINKKEKDDFIEEMLWNRFTNDKSYMKVWLQNIVWFNEASNGLITHESKRSEPVNLNRERTTL